MSSLSYTAQFVRMGRSPFGPKPKEATVFAQHLSGGAGLTIFTNLEGAGPVVRLRQNEALSAQQLMAGFAIAEPGLALEDAAMRLAERFRESASSGELEIDLSDAAVLADAVSSLNVTLILTDCESGVGDFGLDLAFGDWIVMKSNVEWE